MRNHVSRLRPIRAATLAAVTFLAACLPAPVDRGAHAVFSRSPAALEFEGSLGASMESVLELHAPLGAAAATVRATTSAPWLSLARETIPLDPGVRVELPVVARCGRVAAQHVAWVVLEGADVPMTVPVRLTCRDGVEGGGAHDDVLRWAPPVLHDPVLMRVDTEPNALRLDPNTDYIVQLPDRPLTRGLNMRGGRNVVIIGGEIDIPWQGAGASIASRRALHITHATGTVHVEGLLLHGEDISEGIQINAPDAIVQIQNVGVFDIRARDQVRFSDNHPDLIQSYGNAREIRVDRFTGSTDYQGFFFQADFHGPVHGPVHLSRVNLIGAPTSRYLLWFSPGSEDVTLDDVWLDVPAERSGGLGRSVWPDARGAYPERAQVELGEVAVASWPESMSPTIHGFVSSGRPPVGDFVRAEAIGIGYVSPGYRIDPP
jgi:hypothetical protein